MSFLMYLFYFHYFIFYGKIVLQPISGAELLTEKQLMTKNLIAKIIRTEITIT